jgi:hypothetical protein
MQVQLLSLHYLLLSLPYAFESSSSTRVTPFTARARPQARCSAGGGQIEDFSSNNTIKLSLCCDPAAFNFFYNFT